MTNSTPPHHLRALPGEPEWSLLDRYFSSECTPEEADAVARWIAVDGSHAELIDFLRRIWEEGGVVRPVIDEEADWRALSARIAATRSGPTPIRALRSNPLGMVTRRSGRSRIARAVAAAGLAAAVMVAAVWGVKRTTQVPQEIAQSGHEYATDRGQRATIMLVDGTRVWLSVDSRLRVAPGYASSTRDVELEGEAYFEVKHDDELPFRVHTPGAVAEDLGTEFSVRADPGDSATVVVVADGVVALRRAGHARAVAAATAGAIAAAPGVELTRGQMGLLHPSGIPTVVDGVDLTTLLSWRRGALEFQEMPLASAIRELERWYDVEITLGDPSLARVPLTATFDDQSVDQALSIVAGALDVRYERDGRQVRLTTKSARR
jgi:transmembrane sensor